MTTRRTLVILFLLATLPSLAARAATPADLESMLDRVRAVAFIYAMPQSDHLGNVIETLLDAKSSTDALIAELQRKYGVSEPAAHAMLRAWAASKLALDEDDPTPAQLADAAALWTHALDAAPLDVVALEAVEFAANARALPNRDAFLASILERAPDGHAVAIAALNATYDVEISERLLSFAIARDGASDDPMLLLAAAQKFDEEAFVRAAWAQRRHLGDLSTEQEAALAERAIASRTFEGDSATAIAIFESATPAARAAMLANVATWSDYVDFRRGVIELQYQRARIGYAIAAAYLLEGNAAAVPPILGAIRNAADRTEDERRGPLDAALDSLIAIESAMKQPAPDDAFEIAAAFITATEEMDGRSADGVLLRLFDRFGRGAGYERVATYMTDRARRIRSWRDDGAPAPATARLLAGLGVQRAAAPAADSATTATAERLTLHRERPLDPAASRVEPDCATVERLRAEGIVFPPGVAPLRAERRGDDVVGIVLSQRVDPVGEISGGGYWIVRSRDRGATWDFLYTGLRQYRPYEIVASSHPLIGDGGISIEVEVRELDESSITFPPVALRTKREARGLAVDFTWEALTRDSDRDGLTDLLEDRLLLDLHDPDTDGDGIADAADPLPRVAWREEKSVEAEILAHIFAPSVPQQAALITGLGAPENACGPPPLSEGVPAARFILGDAAAFAGVDPPTRLIVLTPAELESANERFGLFFASAVSAIAIDRTGTKAVVAVNDSWRASVYRLEKQEGRWVVTIVGGWIS